MFVAMGSWFLQANRRWIELLEAGRLDLSTDPARHPRDWALGAPSRLRALMEYLLRPDPDPEVERWRIRTINRGVVWFTAVLVVLLISRPVIRLVMDAARRLAAQSGPVFLLGLLAVVSFMIGYYLFVLGREARAFGDGQPVSRTAIVVGCVGLAVTFVGLLWLSATDQA